MYWIDLRHHPPYSRPKDLLLGWLGDGSRHYVDKDDREPPSHIWVSDIPTTPRIPHTTGTTRESTNTFALVIGLSSFKISSHTSYLLNASLI